MRITNIVFAVLVIFGNSKNVLNGFVVPSTLSGIITNEKHPLEDRKSWDLHVERSLTGDVRRMLSDPTLPIKDDVMGLDAVPYTIKHKKPKKHIPFAGGDTIHGMMIDAGSQGSRLHIYEWEKRFLLDQDDLLGVAHGLKLSIPTSSSRWTDKYTPGLDVFAYHKDPEKLKKAIAGYLGPLLDFARKILKDKEDQWSKYPIYLKATGGLRTLSQPDRLRLVKAVRELFHDKTFNPFEFKDERARVISGEEEAIYGWVGVNFAKGTLIDYSEGSGTAINPKLTYGMLEMGGASTQIAVFENNGDLMANLFKLQLGGARHWNVYVHSYLYSGINGAWSRLNARLHNANTVTNPCLPMGSEIKFDSWITMNGDGNFYSRSSPESIPYTLTMVNNQTKSDYDRCASMSYELLRKETNEEWCDFEQDGNCGYAGIYQPPLPKLNKDVDEFIATSNFVDVFLFLQLGERAAIYEIDNKARQVCGLTWKELTAYNANLPKSTRVDDEDTLAQMCFRSVYVYQMLRNGWGFEDDYEITAVDVINGQKLGWALGCMLYEINTLPWDFHPELLMRGPSWWLIILYISLGTLAGSAVGFTIAMRMNKKFNKAVRQSVFFKKTNLSKNPLVRKSLMLPSSELDYLLDDDDDDENEPLAKNIPTKYNS